MDEVKEFIVIEEEEGDRLDVYLSEQLGDMSRSYIQKLIKDKKVTSFFSIKDDMIHAGGIWVDKEVVVSDNILTSRNPGDLPALMKKFVEMIWYEGISIKLA